MQGLKDSGDVYITQVFISNYILVLTEDSNILTRYNSILYRYNNIDMLRICLGLALSVDYVTYNVFM